MSAAELIRVLVADDHPMFRRGLRSVLQSDPRLDVIGEAGTGDEAVTLAVSLEPHVILMDLTMPGLNGVEATKRILAQQPSVSVLVLTMFDDSASVLAAIRAGAHGYLVKGVDGAEILRAVHAAAAGDSIFSSSAAIHLARQLASPRDLSVAIPGLTGREHQVLSLMSSGYTNTAIHERLGLSPKTVRNYISVILTKLDASDRSEAIARARAAGIGEKA